MSTTKEDFESFARVNRLPIDRLVNGERYVSMETEWAWRAWVSKRVPAPGECEWWQEDADDEPGTYTTSCHRRWSFTEGDVADNEMTYCMGCGKKTKDLDVSIITSQPDETEISLSELNDLKF